MSNKSDYATMSSANFKSEIFNEDVLKEIQKGNLVFLDNHEKSPEEKLYIRSFNYDKFPEDITDDEKVILKQIKNKK